MSDRYRYRFGRPVTPASDREKAAALRRTDRLEVAKLIAWKLNRGFQAFTPNVDVAVDAS